MYRSYLTEQAIKIKRYNNQDYDNPPTLGVAKIDIDNQSRTIPSKILYYETDSNGTKAPLANKIDYINPIIFSVYDIVSLNESYIELNFISSIRLDKELVPIVTVFDSSQKRVEALVKDYVLDQPSGKLRIYVKKYSSDISGLTSPKLMLGSVFSIEVFLSRSNIFVSSGTVESITYMLAYVDYDNDNQVTANSLINDSYFSQAYKFNLLFTGYQYIYNTLPYAYTKIEGKLPFDLYKFNGNTLVPKKYLYQAFFCNDVATVVGNSNRFDSFDVELAYSIRTTTDSFIL
jgi:hypothetical protein